MEKLTDLQRELKEIILTYEEKTSGRIDNKNQIKQFNALVRNQDIDEELINFIIDSTDEINTRHFEFVEHTTKAIKDISEITHVDIEKLKGVMHKLPKHKDDKEEVKPVDKSKTTPVVKKPWYHPSAWSISDAKFFVIVGLLLVCITVIVVFADNPEVLKNLSGMFNSTVKAK